MKVQLSACFSPNRAHRRRCRYSICESALIALLLAGESAIPGVAAELPAGGIRALPAYSWRGPVLDQVREVSPVRPPLKVTTPVVVRSLGNYGTVQAKVYDGATSFPVPGALVTVATTGLATSSGSCSTDLAGSCTLMIDAGITATLEASKSSFQTLFRNATVASSGAVTVEFPLTGAVLQPVRIAANYYPNLSTAYASAVAGSTVQLKSQPFTGPFSFNRTIAVKLEGGYDAAYNTLRTGYSELTGPVTVNGGAGCQVTFDRMVVR